MASLAVEAAAVEAAAANAGVGVFLKKKEKKLNMKTNTFVKISLGLVMAIMVSFAQSASALTEAELDKQAPPIPVVQSDKNTESQPLEKVDSVNIEASNHDISFKKQINGDAICASSTRCVIDGVVEDDALVAAMSVEIRGEIKGDLRAAANELVIESGAKVLGNVSIFAPKITIKQGAVLGKDAMLMGGLLRAEGQIGRDLTMSGDESYLEGQVGRNAEIKSAKHTRVATTAKIAGNLYNTSATKDIAESAVAGEFKHEDFKNSEKKERSGISASLIWSLSIGTLVAVVAIFRPDRFKKFSREKFKLINIFYIGIGYLVLIGLPIVAILLATTVIGMPVAMLMIVLWLLALILAIPLAIYYLTTNTLMIFDKDDERLAVVVGVAVYVLINLMPVLSVVINLALVGLGAGLFIKLLVSEFGKGRLNNKQTKEA